MPTLEQFNQDLRRASGEVSSADPLTLIFYLLMRDHVPSGDLSAVVVKAVEGHQVCEYTNGFLAAHAGYLAELVYRHVVGSEDD